jgi:hypothetical protein
LTYYSGKIALDDINVLLELTTVQSCRPHLRGIIHGVRFRGRGPGYAASNEDQLDDTEELKKVVNSSNRMAQKKTVFKLVQIIVEEAAITRRKR